MYQLPGVVNNFTLNRRYIVTLNKTVWQALES
jgi:hypothetical protein